MHIMIHACLNQLLNSENLLDNEITYYIGLGVHFLAILYRHINNTNPPMQFHCRKDSRRSDERSDLGGIQFKNKTIDSHTEISKTLWLKMDV